MKPLSIYPLFILLWLLAGASAQANIALESKDSPQVAAQYGKLPMSFEANRGQTDPAVRFLSRGPGYALFITPTEAVFSLRKAASDHSNGKSGLGAQSLNPASGVAETAEKARAARSTNGGQREIGAATVSAVGRAARANPNAPTNTPDETLAVRMQLVGANPNASIAGLDELPGKVNYIKGNDPKRWQTGVATYGKVKLENVYDGVALVYYGNGRQLEYDFIVAPGADPKAIRLNFYSDKTPVGELTGPQWSIVRLAGELHKHIECVLSGDCMYPQGTKVDRVDIVAHSMGGLITRAYIAGMAKDADNGDAAIPYNAKIRRIVTAGTPHYGASLASLKRLLLASPDPKKRALAFGVLPKQVIDLNFGSPFIWSLNERWRSQVVTPGIFDSDNLLTVAGTTDLFSLTCTEGVTDGIVYIPSATLPNDELNAFLPDSQIRYAQYPHASGFCTAFPTLVGVNPDSFHVTYQLAKSFLKGVKVPNYYTPADTIRNHALLLVRIVDSVTKKPINPAPALGFNAALKLNGSNYPATLNSDGGTLTAVPIPLTGSQQTVTLQIVPPSGYQTPASTQVTLKAGRPTVRLLYLVPK